MIKGVHLLTPCPNMLISLIDQFRIFNGWTAGRTQARIQDFCQGVGVQARPPEYRIRTWDQYIHTYVHVGIHTYAHKCSCTGRRMDIHVHV